ncbi:MBL fold metallo-hydrolase [Carboxylicivirga taeanensis]|uniref:MBL fold metallo-hydrolase n=1 Tax=Carboxylicivirga taeanensis TaxID=1416875 RepID=UPI003F6E1C2D
MRISTLIDNRQNQKQLKCEHGLSFLLQTHRYNILFDTGQSDNFLANARAMDIDLRTVDYVVLSHGHYDHTGGLPAFLELNSKARIIVHKMAFKERFSQSSKMTKANGIGWSNKSDHCSERFILLDKDMELSDGTRILCQVRALKNFEVVNERLVVKEGDKYVPDTFEDELILVAQNKQKVVVLCGCAHTGIVNILHTIKNRLHHNSFSCIAGGLHLNGSSPGDISHVIQGLAPFRVDKWLLNHCTGNEAFDHFTKAFPGVVTYAGSGYSISI